MTESELLKYVTFRPYQDQDKAFIYSSWLRSFFVGSDFCHHISNTVFYENHHRRIEEILNRPHASVIIATAQDEPNIILGYAVFDVGSNLIVHYVYVKEAFRKDGLATHMLRCINQDLKKLTISHLTNSPCMEHMRKKYELVYNPYLM